MRKGWDFTIREKFEEEFKAAVGVNYIKTHEALRQWLLDNGLGRVVEKPKYIRSYKEEVRIRSNLCIEHKGEEVRQIFILRVPKDEPVILRVSFKKYVSDIRQGLHIETDGKLEVNGLRKSKIGLWVDTAPQDVEIKCKSKSGEVFIWNIWEPKPGAIHSLINCAGIIVERKTDRTWLLRCNDGYPDDDFKDLIVEVSLDEEV